MLSILSIAAVAMAQQSSCPPPKPPLDCSKPKVTVSCPGNGGFQKDAQDFFNQEATSNTLVQTLRAGGGMCCRKDTRILVVKISEYSVGNAVWIKPVVTTYKHFSRWFDIVNPPACPVVTKQESDEFKIPLPCYSFFYGGDPNDSHLRNCDDLGKITPFGSVQCTLTVEIGDTVASECCEKKVASTCKADQVY